ncbi:hypothetical protein QE390_000215 [Siphonobacter sp. SORGH_AS 1065]|nr:hypothetical protein [Siphonobacter sp. SORGH_AS_1065]
MAWFWVYWLRVYFKTYIRFSKWPGLHKREPVITPVVPEANFPSTIHFDPVPAFHFIYYHIQVLYNLPEQSLHGYVPGSIVPHANAPGFG